MSFIIVTRSSNNKKIILNLDKVIYIRENTLTDERAFILYDSAEEIRGSVLVNETLNDIENAIRAQGQRPIIEL